MCWSIWSYEIKLCPSLSTGAFVTAYETLMVVLHLFPEAVKNVKKPKL